MDGQKYGIQTAELKDASDSVVERIQVLTDEGPQLAWVLATNVYVKTSLGWRLVAHHAPDDRPD